MNISKLTCRRLAFCALLLTLTLGGNSATRAEPRTSSRGVVPPRSGAPKDDTARASTDFFEKKIRPVLVQHCYKCHSAQSKKVRGGLLLDTREGIRKGGDNGPAVVPGKPRAGLLLSALHYEDFRMPPAGKLPARVIADFETWIKQGAIDPRVEKVAGTGPRKIDIEQGKKFWSFQPPKRHPLPPSANAAWPEKRIDWFVSARLQEAGFEPTAPADRQTLIRRVTFGLIGLPPTPEEVQAFVQDSSPDAYEKLVDRLLASPHHGERWARPWLDVARYAEDQAHIVGNNKSLFYPNAYLYRDWVVNALNADLPYDRFVQLQLAADLIEPKETENLPALGYLGLGPKYYGRGSLAVKADEWEDRVDVVSRGLQGLTVACARCHDHKFDPIPTQDYYSLAGVFASTTMYNRPLPGKPTPGKKKKGKRNKRSPEHAMHIVREGKPNDLNVFVRGNVKSKGPLAPRRFLRVLSQQEPKRFTKGSGRLELAQAIANRDNPLTARVIVNRVWGQLIGQHLVRTPSNFGFLGERPTHPQLLDDLAVRFMENGWSLKWLQREIVLSATYRQSSKASPSLVQADPENRLLGRMNRQRLSVESWRDNLLAVCGQLDQKVGGKSLDPQDPRQRRRTLYSYISRLDLNPMLALFDFPDPNAHSARRAQTTTPLQKMFVLNSPFMVHQARALVTRLHQEIPSGAVASDKQAQQQRIQRAYALLYGRPARDEELQLGLAYLASDSDPQKRWQQYAHVLLASNEMLFID